MTALRNVIAGLYRAVFFAAVSTLLGAAALAQTAPVHDEAKVKAAFLLRFAQFVAWPQEALLRPDTPFVIGIAGAEAIGAELAQQSVSSRATLGRPVIVRNAKAEGDVRAVHLLFVGADEQSRIAQYAAAVRGQHVLVVTESPGALEQGGMINFVVADRRVKFEIALNTAERERLVLSSRLLAVAMRVLKGGLETPGYRVARTTSVGAHE